MNPSIRLHKGKDRSVRNFHPWIFSGAIASDVRGLEEGQVVDVTDAAGNHVATGHFHKGTIMVRVLSFTKENIDQRFWQTKLSDALSVRKSIPGLIHKETNAFRLIHGEGDHLPGLVIDYYNGCVVLQTHSEGMKSAATDIAEAVSRLENLAVTTIFHRHVSSDGNGLIKGDQTQVEILENNHRFKVDFAEGQKTGFFLDQRENRMLLANYAEGKRVLNTYCYTGGFSVYALKAGAIHVDSVDSSAKATQLTSENIELNNSTGTHAVHTSDVPDFLKQDTGEYDIIILDPPAFAKHLSAVDKATIGYRNINEMAIRKIKPGGLIFTFSCSQAIDRELFRKIIFMASAKTERQVRILHQLTQGPDHPVNVFHPEGEYLKGLVLSVC